MMTRRVESMTCSQPGCPARLTAAMLRRAFLEPILATPPIRATQPWSLSQMCVKGLSRERNVELFSGQEPLTKSNTNFPLELRAKTRRLITSNGSCRDLGTKHPRRP
jgi:hypothetical protein